jgi:hypothetical protein
VDYDLTRLGDREFEHLTQALALQVLGTGVSVFGDGPDGGREATFEGRTRFPEPGEHWDGYGVVQAKFKRRPVGGTRDVTDLLRAIQAELTTWADPHSNRVRKGRRPQYLLFTTNVALSAVPGEGGIDRVNALIERYADRLALKGWQVWHYDQLCRLLDQHPQVRRTYAALITSSDVLACLQELLDGTAATIGQRLTVHAAKELTAQQWVRLDQAGHPDNQKLLLSEVAVDLPAVADPLRDATRLQGHARLPHGRIVRAADYRPYELPGVVAHLVQRGDAVLRPSCQPMTNPRVVLVGGPGQGKSTLGQLLCQVYRVALLSDRPETSLGPAAVQVLWAQRSQLARLAIPNPSCRRWPLQVSLSAYGDAIAGGEDVSLLRFLADQVSRHEPGLVTANQLRLWLAEWPWVLVLDGLDEVAAPTVREALLQHIADFLTDAADADADLMIVATTRPQGYAQELPTAHYEHLELRPLSSREAVRYAERLAAVRHVGDAHLEAQVVARLTQAADDPLTARLMRSPLQVTIMSILLERRVRAPKDRHGLFEAYYHTIYEREVAKPGTVGQLLEQQRGHVNALHERVGLLLQIRAEHAGDADALLPNQDLHRLASQRLLVEGYADADADDLATQLVTAATTRLVLLVPRTVDAVGFEIRSLQEFMAASALVADDDSSVLRLRQLAPSAHWHNTWLLAAGRVFAQREHLRDPIVTLLEDIDTADLLALLVLPGAQLAVAILDDAIAAQTPRYQRLFAKRALALIEFPLPTDTTKRLADTFLEICQADSQTRLMIDQTLDRMVASDAPAAICAITILARWEEHVGPIAASARQRLQRLVRQLSRSQEEALVPLAARYPTGPLAPLLRAADPNAKRKPRTLPRVVRRHVPLGALEPEVEKRVRLLLDRLPPIPLLPDDAQPVFDDASASDHPVHDEGPPDDPTLTDPRVGEVLVHAAEELATPDWQAAAALRGVLAYWLARRVAGEQLLG